MSARGRIPQRVYPGGDIGPPLRGGGGVPNQRKIGAKTGPCLRGGTEPAPYRRQEQNGCGGVRLGCGFRRPNFVPKFGASVMGIGPYALWGTARRGRRALRMVAESRRDCPGQRRTAERLRRGREGWVEVGAEITPEGAINAGQSLSQPAADSSLYTREPLGTGDADCRVGPLGLLAMTMVPCHSEERGDVGIRSFLRCTGVRAAEVVGPYGRSTEGPATGRCGHRPLRVVAESHRDCQGSALSAERVAGQIQVLPDN